MISGLMKFGVGGATVLLLSGCCSNVTTDPREGGLAGGVCGTASGTYDQRIVTLESRANSLQAANVGLQTRLAKNNSKANSLGRDIAAKRQKLAAMQSDLDELEQLAGEKASLRAEIGALKAEAGKREARVMAIEKGMRTASNDRIRDDARRQAEGIPVDDLLKRIRNLRTEAK